MEWKYIVIDEAQRMKDRESKLAKDLERFITSRRLLLTGAPQTYHTLLSAQAACRSLRAEAGGARRRTGQPQRAGAASARGAYGPAPERRAGARARLPRLVLPWLSCCGAPARCDRGGARAGTPLQNELRELWALLNLLLPEVGPAA